MHCSRSVCFCHSLMLYFRRFFSSSKVELYFYTTVTKKVHGKPHFVDRRYSLVLTGHPKVSTRFRFRFTFKRHSLHIRIRFQIQNASFRFVSDLFQIRFRFISDSLQIRFRFNIDFLKTFRIH